MSEIIWNQKALYFRISRDGFMCKIPNGKNDVAVLHPDLKDLEAILQAVKKTQNEIHARQYYNNVKVEK